MRGGSARSRPQGARGRQVAGPRPLGCARPGPRSCSVVRANNTGGVRCWCVPSVGPAMRPARRGSVRQVERPHRSLRGADERPGVPGRGVPASWEAPPEGRADTALPAPPRGRQAAVLGADHLAADVVPNASVTEPVRAGGWPALGWCVRSVLCCWVFGWARVRKSRGWELSARGCCTRLRVPPAAAGVIWSGTGAAARPQAASGSGHVETPAAVGVVSGFGVTALGGSARELRRSGRAWCRGSSDSCRGRCRAWAGCVW